MILPSRRRFGAKERFWRSLQATGGGGLQIQLRKRAGIHDLQYQAIEFLRRVDPKNGLLLHVGDRSKLLIQQQK